jgi:hypothetical protein
MGYELRLVPILTNRRYTFLFFWSIATAARLMVWAALPLDWNSDSFHHWQISFWTLKVGLLRGRMWDLNGCEYYWGVVPHLVQASVLGILFTSSILPLRALNMMLGGVNAYLVFLIGRNNVSWRVGLYAGLMFALYPVAAIFDIIAMQETLALMFALVSVHTFRSHPWVSGVFLALACQSRIEFWLVSIIFISCVALVHRLSERVLPFIISWIVVTLAFCLLFRVWTSNPVYPLYWSLYNVFGGWTPEGYGQPIQALMLRYVSAKLAAWVGKPTGLSLIAAGFSFLYVLIRQLRGGRRGHILLFFSIVLIVFAPLFVTYYPGQISNLLLMLRMSIPIFALGSVLLVTLLLKAQLRLLGGRLKALHLEKVTVVLVILSYVYFIPAYDRFQVDPASAFEAADGAMAHYRGGTVICDYPTMNYRFVSHWGLDASSVLGNHYAPHYYGVTDPVEFARWFHANNVTLWINAGSRALPVLRIVSQGFPGLLVKRGEVNGVEIYEVDNELLMEALLEVEDPAVERFDASG